MTENSDWYDLSDAAQILGAHFTTLRRWADAGEIEFIRTPGGRRRFHKDALQNFLQSRKHSPASELSGNMGGLIIDRTRQDLQTLKSTSKTWMRQIQPEQQLQMRRTGNQLIALLVQYSTHTTNAEVFLGEARKIIEEYGQVCIQAQISLPQAVRVFLFFQQSILDSLDESRLLSGRGDLEGHPLFQRASHFFEEILITLIDQYHPDQ